MTQLPDNLFRDKLQNFQLTAPGGAWSRIETGLDHSSRKGLWLKIAAGLALLVTAGALLWNSDNQTLNPVAATTQIETKPQADAYETSPNTVRPTEEIAQIPDPAPVNRQKSRIRNTNLAVATASAVQDIPEPSEIQTQGITVSTVELVEAVHDQEQGETNSAKYIVYTAEEVNAKYLRKMPEEDATSAEKKSSRMQMLAGIAHNLKSGESGLGDLRQIKDEIFALNFLDSKKEQSKRN